MILPQLAAKPNFTATRNACKLCTPLGACLVFRGIEGCVPFLHGSQGCSTYIRRYMISHFKEPVDIASSNFSEHSAVYGGGENLRVGLTNVIKQYQPQLVGLATTCLSETIGDDLPMHLHQFLKENRDQVLPPIVHVSTASYRGTHMDGFHDAVRAVVDTLHPAGTTSAPPAPPAAETTAGTATTAHTESAAAKPSVNLFPGMVSPADIRHLKRIVRDFGLEPIVLPDYSETLDGATWDDYHRIPPGGTPVAQLRRMDASLGTIECGSVWNRDKTAGALLQQRRGTPRYEQALPIGVRQTDAFLRTLAQIAGCDIPAEYVSQRGRLLDAMVDAHKHCFEVRAVVYGEQDLVVGLTSLLAEMGVVPVLCASGEKTNRFAQAINDVCGETAGQVRVLEGMDFLDIEEEAARVQPDLVIGHSKGYQLAKKLNVPLVRVGFPIHDRIGGARLLHVGYEGAQRLFDQIVNTVIEGKQNENPWGYSYM